MSKEKEINPTSVGNVEVFRFDQEKTPIRVQLINNEPWFVATDVCQVLGISNNRDAVSRLDDDEKATSALPTQFGVKDMWLVSESGLYSLIFQSRKPESKIFRKWVTSDVLPTIRKTGSYSVKKQHREPSMSTKVRIGLEWAKGVSEMLNLNDASKLSLLGKVAAPFNLPLPDYVSSKGVLKSASELLRERNIPISAQSFNKRAVEKGLLCEHERNTSCGLKKKFKSITNKGLAYGENQINPNNPKSTQPLWYDDMFNDLLSVLGFVKVEDVSYENC